MKWKVVVMVYAYLEELALAIPVYHTLTVPLMKNAAIPNAFKTMTVSVIHVYLTRIVPLNETCCDYKCVKGNNCDGYPCKQDIHCSVNETCSGYKCVRGNICVGYHCVSHSHCSFNEICCGFKCVQGTNCRGKFCRSNLNCSGFYERCCGFKYIQENKCAGYPSDHCLSNSG